MRLGDTLAREAGEGSVVHRPLSAPSSTVPRKSAPMVRSKSSCTASMSESVKTARSRSTPRMSTESSEQPRNHASFALTSRHMEVAKVERAKRAPSTTDLWKRAEVKSHSSNRHDGAISTSLNTARVNPQRVKRERSSRPWSKRTCERKPQVSARTSRKTVFENPLVVTHSFSMSRSSSRHSGACTSMSATLLQRIARMVTRIQSASVICTSVSAPPSKARSLAATSLACTPLHSQPSKRVSPHVGSTRRRSVQGDSTKRQKAKDALLRLVRAKVQRTKVQCANSAPQSVASVKSQSTNITCSTFRCSARSSTNDPRRS